MCIFKITHHTLKTSKYIKAVLKQKKENENKTTIIDMQTYPIPAHTGSLKYE